MTTDVTDWLARNALPLTTLSAGAPTDDLQPLRDILDGVRIVGLGESTHGTGEFFRLKHRLLEFLVTELGFTTLAMEASASAGAAVDAYVRHGTGDAVRVLTGLGFWTWRTHEVLAMIEWMRAYNRGRPEARRIRFVGVDPQRCGDSIEALDAYLRGTAPDRVTWLRDRLGPLAEAQPGSRPDLRERLTADARDLLESLGGPQAQTPRQEADGPPRDRDEPLRQADGSRRESADEPRRGEAAEAIRHARILVRAADLVTRPRRHADPDRTVFAARDRYMAEAVTELVGSDPRARIVFWAHNGHISRGRYGGGVPAAGRHLSARHGDAYYALGLLFGRGAFRAGRVLPVPWARPAVRTVTGNRIGPPVPASVEARLAAARPGDHLVDLRAAAHGPEPVRRWVSGSHVTRTFGAHVPRWVYRLNFSPTVPGDEFDGLAYVAVSTPSRPLTR
ncbi:erythromycin esterase family protein [Streptomyces sp. NPDC004609]|uniref:erythromycin esterase family protein n=1 Tax=Streptomyces sp. NPDC004609 TaxID=3364704 RepID=UPI0036C8C1BC